MDAEKLLLQFYFGKIEKGGKRKIIIKLRGVIAIGPIKRVKREKKILELQSRMFGLEN